MFIKKKLLAEFLRMKPLVFLSLFPPHSLFFPPSLSPFFFFLNCIFCGEAYIFVSAGDTLIETKINKSAEKLTPTAHSRALKTRL